MGASDTFALFIEARGGDPSARGELLESLRARLVLWCASRMSAALRARMEPEDLAQETLLAVHRDFDAFAGQDRGTFYAWVFRIAENRIRDAADRVAAGKRQEREIPVEAVTTPGTAAARREAVLRLAAAIERLPDDHRRVVRMRRFEERSYAEIAAELGRTETAARIVYCRALKALRADLGESG